MKKTQDYRKSRRQPELLHEPARIRRHKFGNIEEVRKIGWPTGNNAEKTGCETNDEPAWNTRNPDKRKDEDADTRQSSPDPYELPRDLCVHFVAAFR
ncbi:hypothetical protein [Thalassoroseus pseudoceratinae]|uniref:hypothetical protein n=1 Tax=Thalassoroseus pseudoceratinae TaxID=2713176 RepID=UPI00141E8CAE|nr:hypothetical protein [Thalassoroseus pseudoceratinae]